MFLKAASSINKFYVKHDVQHTFSGNFATHSNITNSINMSRFQIDAKRAPQRFFHPFWKQFVQHLFHRKLLLKLFLAAAYKTTKLLLDTKTTR